MKPIVTAALAVGLLIVGFVLGRSTGSPPAPTATVTPVPASPVAMPPSSQTPPAPAATVSISGNIQEAIQVPQYTYLRIKTSSGEAWTAIPSTPELKVGERVEIVAMTEMTDFSSRTLGRTFAQIWFGDLAKPGETSPASSSSNQLPANHPPIAQGGPSSTISKALAATTKTEAALSLRVADIYAERSALSGKWVRVKGVASHVSSAGGVTYVDLKDGSGIAGDKTDILPVATTASIGPNESVVVEGRVSLNKAFATGSTQAVVLDEAKIVKP